ncbi:MAG TPA: helix-turn-helix domain-containing protein [Nitrososphaera sp.]
MSELEFLRVAGIWKILGRRWTIAILDSLNAAEERRFIELKNALRISSTMLSERLLELEKEGVVEKKIHSSMPPKVKYRLTDAARELLVIMRDLGIWRARWNSASQNDKLATIPLSS